MVGADMRPPCLLLLSLLFGGLAQKAPTYQLDIQELLEVQEGLCAHVPCSFNHSELQLFYNIYVYYFRVGADINRDSPVASNNKEKQVSRDTQDRFSLFENPRSQNCSLSISDARRSDEGTYFIRMEQISLSPMRVEYNFPHPQLHIRVTDLTQKPTIRSPEPLVTGRAGRLICSLPGACNKTKLSFSWAGEMIDPNTEASSELILTPRLQDHGRNLSCRVTVLSTGKSTEGTIQLNVFYAPQNLSTHVSFRATSGLGAQSIQLLCRADSNPPAEMSWIPVSQGAETALSKATISGNHNNPGNEADSQNVATLEMHLADFQEDAELICQARNYLGTQTVSLRLSVPESLTNSRSESWGSWQLVLMLIRGTLMGAGFLLTYGLTWVYYSRCGGAKGQAESPKSS